MLIRRNTKAFKTIHSIVNACANRPDRQDMIRVFITKAGDSVSDRIDTASIREGADLFYEMTYQAVLANLDSGNHQLHESEENPGLFFFHRGAGKTWDETPFEFDEIVLTEFKDLENLPVPRKKVKPGKYDIAATAKRKPVDSNKSKKQSNKVQNQKPEAAKPKPVENQPRYKIKHKIVFTNLKGNVGAGGQVTKKDVLDYYDGFADFILPHLRDRELSVGLGDQRNQIVPLTYEILTNRHITDLPDWIKRQQTRKGGEQILMCDDRDHLLFYVESGCFEFYASPARIKSDNPDYLVIHVDSPDFELAKAVHVAIEAEVILRGLGLSPVTKTDGKSGLHIYAPLDAKSDFKTAESVGEYVCKLLRLKLPDNVGLGDTSGYIYGKVSLDFTLGKDTRILAPYSLVMGDHMLMSAPLHPGELSPDLRQDDFTISAMLKRKKVGSDPFVQLNKGKVNAKATLATLDKYYTFLV